MSISRAEAGHLDFSDVADFSLPRVPLMHPGKILLEEWMKPLGISQYALAKAIQVPPRRVNEIVHGTRAITVDTALRLSAFFGTDAQSWLNLQARYETETARESLRDVLSGIHRYSEAKIAA